MRSVSIKYGVPEFSTDFGQKGIILTLRNLESYTELLDIITLQRTVMNVIEIPFVDKVGIQRNTDGELELPFNTEVQNHLETIHASAQFALAETASGEILQKSFPELVGKVIPVLRESKIKFKKPAYKKIVAYPSVTAESLSKFEEQISEKGRALISVEVQIKDVDGIVTCTGIFKWFVQRIDKYQGVYSRIVKVMNMMSTWRSYVQMVRIIVAVGHSHFSLIRTVYIIFFNWSCLTITDFNSIKS